MTEPSDSEFLINLAKTDYMGGAGFYFDEGKELLKIADRLETANAKLKISVEALEAIRNVASGRACVITEKALEIIGEVGK
jgi:hypothetical protein